MTIVVWILLVLRAVELIVSPFLVGREYTHDANSVLGAIIMFALTLVVCGRVLCWW